MARTIPDPTEYILGAPGARVTYGSVSLFIAVFVLGPMVGSVDVTDEGGGGALEPDDAPLVQREVAGTAGSKAEDPIQRPIPGSSQNGAVEKRRRHRKADRGAVQVH